MPSFNIVKTIKKSTSFRDCTTYDRFNMNNSSLRQVFSGTIEYPDNWNIGLVIGASGTGKSTILNELYSEYLDNYTYNNDKSVLDNMPDNVTTQDVHKAFNSVGFSSTPSWLKPYNVLSNGEKMRVDLARAILLNRDIIVFDEFTSVVDRQVAKVGAFATQKSVRREKKKFIAFTCHYDVEQWLMPDFVFSTDEMKTLYKKRRFLQRPDIKIRIYEITEKNYYWDMFKRYHYLTGELHPGAKCFIMTCDGTIAAFTSYLHMPNKDVKNFKRDHRTVVLPDWQGLGLSNILQCTIGEKVVNEGFRYISTTTNPAMCYIRKKSDNWKLTRVGRVSKSILMAKASSSNRITTSWEYIKTKKEI